MMWLLKKGIYLLIVLVAVLTGVTRYHKILPAYKTLTLTLAATFIFESVAITLAYNGKINTAIYSLFDYFELTGFLAVFYLLYTERLFKLITLIFFALFILLKVLFDNQTLFAGDLSTISKSIFFIICSLMLYLNWLISSNTPKIYKTAAFFFCNAILIFFTINLLFWTCYSVNFYNNLKLRFIFGQLLYYSNIFLYAFLGISLYLAGKQNSL